MRIGVFAELAGVTVRTVRHYHREGVLPEPPRRGNGYREYTVDDLVTMLRIRELVRTGLSLAQAGAMVADTVPASADAALEEVDRALQAQIAELTGRRRRLAQARSGRHVGMSRLAAALTVSPTGSPAAVLAAHLYGDRPEVDALVDVLLATRLRAALVSAQERFDAVDATTTAAELDALAADVRSIVAEISRYEPTAASDDAQLVQTLVERDLNEQQKQLLRHI